MLATYLPILVFILLATGLAGGIIVASLLVAPRAPDKEKLSPYECGFEPFDDAAANSTFVFIWWRFCLSFLTLRWPFCSPGRYR
jgi:NADH:ubiquinone oxidoreductase subunit 3 (subunit A)